MAALLTDSIQPFNNFEPRKTRISGHIHKGHSRIAASASIPSKYQTVVISNEERRGFNSGSQRFDHSSKFTESPGPAKYSLTQSILRENHESHSKKGLGGFVSKVKRFPRLLNNGYSVEPGQYNPPSFGLSHDFNKAKCTSNFHKPIAVMNDSRKFQTPAPNQYFISGKSTGRLARENNRVACAAFFSKTSRDFLPGSISNNAPAPGTYNIADEWVQSDSSTQVPFKSTTQRNLLPPKSVLENPGPGTYNPYEKVIFADRKQLLRKHYLCISAPAIPMPPEPDAPGPGQYDLVNYEGPPKQYATSSMFVSTTNRWTGKRLNSLPGPGTYDPQRHNKISFMYNADKKWI